MKIGVDARPLCYPGTGIHRYTIELLKRMTALGGDEWFLYSDRQYDKTELSGDNIHHRCGNYQLPKLSTLYAQLLFPHWAKKDQIDVFWSPRHNLPLALSSSTPSVVTIHDLVWIHYGSTMTQFGRLLESILMPRAIASSKIVVAVSEFTRCDIKQNFPYAENKTQVVTGASCLSPDTVTLDKTVSDQKNYFLFVSTLEPRKNLNRLLLSYKQYLDKTPEPLPLKIAGGSGWGGVSIESVIAQHGISAHVSLLGQVTDQQLAQLYKNAYALLMPSLYEGFGLPIVEAMSQGVPVITSNLSAMKEVAGAGGILVDPYSVEEMCDALSKITSDSEHYQQLAAAALLQSQKYNWEKSAATMLNILHQSTKL
ncbi:glycosyltransferase family 4 protein [Oceanicoccus sagamiensis]|uniref:Glycosyl transferase family 1 domain-containing protein n=1 Tax=Oceanicoccus sagamiensis TaxID=716816 RepID=A0A1X9NBG1_9GAMM|nr:glycosyltransferase family 1 protein [Oceanicoccus sagamiensis]ARN74946.1 hypothetical protein BST96_12975 [Oceanicoccus sagamiensis]